MNTLLLAAWISCQSLDIGTTIYALNNGNFKDVNPLMSSPGRVITLKVSINIGTGLLYHEIRKPGSKKRMVIPIVMSTHGCISGIINLKTIK